MNAIAINQSIKIIGDRVLLCLFVVQMRPPAIHLWRRFPIKYRLIYNFPSTILYSPVEVYWPTVAAAAAVAYSHCPD